MDPNTNYNQYKMAQQLNSQNNSKTAKRKNTVVNEAQFRDQMIRGPGDRNIPGLSKELATGYINKQQFDFLSGQLSLMQEMEAFGKRFDVDLDPSLQMFDGKIRTMIQLSKSVDATGLVEANTSRNVQDVRETLDGMQEDKGFLDKLKALASGGNSKVMPEQQRMMGNTKGDRFV